MMGGWGNMMGSWGGYGYGGFSWMGMMFIPLLIIIGMVFYIFRNRASRATVNSIFLKNTAPDILRERYASGEIDATEFQSKMQDLEGRINLQK
ncbi:SHOCT domain-containing protein [Desulfosporosinus sp. FKA]|uniref:SHOCT domain-containing protein n=1 Tax=Desulfosporosinus sp. FKA TaxID=1969834 RepID=UPI000B499F9D|nr:SHOCT domain-containing protein [Desulfosporosinus sp. FKA]